MPSTTPATSWIARPVRSPWAAPTAITAAIAANAGRGSGSNRTATYQAMTAAAAVCTIASMRPRRRTRAAPAAPRMRVMNEDGRIISSIDTSAGVGSFHKAL